MIKQPVKATIVLKEQDLNEEKDKEFQLLWELAAENARKDAQRNSDE